MKRIIKIDTSERTLFMFMFFFFFISGCGGRLGIVEKRSEAEINPIVVNPDIKPFYPVDAQLKGYQGEVILHLLVTDSGRVQHVKIGHSSGYAILDETALEYGKKLRFRPAMRKGIPVSIWLTWTVSYHLETDENAFQPMEYVRNVQKWMEQAEQQKRHEREVVLEEIWAQHASFKKVLKQKTETNFNPYLELFLSPTVLEIWKPFWKEWPLHFTVYQDFLLRFPDSPQAETAKKELVNLFRSDFQRIRAIEKSCGINSEMYKQFVRTAHTFLRSMFPDDLEKRIETGFLNDLLEFK